MPYQLIGLAGPTATQGMGAHAVGAHIRPTLFFGHGHADGQRLLLRHGHVTVVVLAGHDLGRPLGSQIVLFAQGRNGGRGHGYGATVCGIDLALQVELGSAGHLRAGAWIGPM